MQRIAGLERALEQAQHLLHQDDLTPLLNRRGFRRACDRWAGNGPMAMSACCAMIDLDGFKAINDTHGHDAGDHFLAEIAARLRETLRQQDFAARHGGDEFVVIGPGPAAGTPMEPACQAFGQRLAEATRGHFAWPGFAIDYPGASVGVIAAQGLDADEALRQGDQAMYAVKRARCARAVPE